jgi:hypothetical protein
MAHMFWELWRLARYLLRPEKAGDPGYSRGDTQSAPPALAALAGFGLAQLR